MKSGPTTQGSGTGGVPLLFYWGRDGIAPWFKLGGFVLVSVLVHGAFFYLFRVVYPKSERVLPTPVEVLLLTEESPGVQAYLRSLDDRDAAYRSSVLGSVSGALDLGTFATVYAEEEQEAVELGYRASYIDHEPPLRAWPGERGEFGLPVLSESGAIPMLPPSRVDGVEEAAGGEAAVEKISVIPGGALAGRTVESIPEVDPAGWSGGGSGRVVFMVGVERAGRTVFRMPTERGGLPDVSQMSRFISQLVFAPGEAGSPATEWGMVELVW